SPSPAGPAPSPESRRTVPASGRCPPPRRRGGAPGSRPPRGPRRRRRPRPRAPAVLPRRPVAAPPPPADPAPPAAPAPPAPPPPARPPLDRLHLLRQTLGQRLQLPADVGHPGGQPLPGHLQGGPQLVQGPRRRLVGVQELDALRRHPHPLDVRLALRLGPHPLD